MGVIGIQGHQYPIDAIGMAAHLLDDFEGNRRSLNQLNLEAQGRETPSGRSTVTAALDSPPLEAAARRRHNHSAQQNYAGLMIRSFRCPDTKRLAQEWAMPRFQAFERVARRKLRQPAEGPAR